MSFYPPFEKLPEDPILGLAPLFKADQRKEKINLGIGTYLDEMGQPYLFPSVKVQETLLLREEKNKEYLPIDGYLPFIQGVKSLVLPGDGCALQTLGGTGALSLFAELIARFPQKPTVYITDPTWANHLQIFTMQGLEVKKIPYFDPLTHTVRFDDFKKTVSEAKGGSVFVLHTSCHNPTGCDLSLSDWSSLASLFKSKGHFALFDTAYLGFAGTVQEDSEPIRLFDKEGVELAVTLSFAKCMGLYSERVGALLLNNSSEALHSHLKRVARSTYSNPPSHGAKVAALILKDPSWPNELSHIRERLKKMRRLLAGALPEKFQFIERENGLFSLLPLTPEEVLTLREEKGIYMLSSGRINLAGVNEGNIEKLIDALRKT